ncbi:MAG: hypothetical protein EOM10_14615, partial [Opitutae bacterium]|nr:hypothetical protein [Opitutae bacterium]
VQVVMVGAVPLSRPARLFWTETPYDAPKVNLQGLFPVIHPNAEVSAPVYEVTTNVNGGVTNVISNVVSGVWIDDQKQLHAKGVTGMFVLEYYKEGSYDAQIRPDGIEVVQVLEPEVQVLRADIGSRLLPADSYWAQVDGNAGVVPAVQAGLNETAYAVDMAGPKDGWVFSIQRTVDEPWSLEIYWQHPGLMGVLWPYEVDWYECEWPAHPQVRVVSASPSTTAAVVIPDGLTAHLMPEMDPAGHAALSTSGKSLMMSEPGRCLMKYTTSDNIWFEVVQSVSRTNAAYFDLDARDWDIGEELRPPGAEAHALVFDGTNDHVIAGHSWLNQQTNWTLSLWFQPGEVEPGPLSTEGDPDVTFEVSVLTNRALSVALWNRHLSPPVYWKRMQTPANVVQPHVWQHVAVTLTGGDDSNGTVRLVLDDQSWETNGLQRVNFEGTGQAVIGAVSHWAPHITNSFFRGRID